MSTNTNPSVIRSIAVTAEDVITAVETNRTSQRTAVHRVTPPFSGRMRARLHVRQGGKSETDSIHIPPTELLDESAPAYPRPPETEDELRSDPDMTYSVENHRQYHEQVVDQWRTEATAAIRESLSLPTLEDGSEVTVHVLGDS